MAARILNSKTPAPSKQRDDGRIPTVQRLAPLFLNWFTANARDLPWRQTHDAYAIWISEIMLQQTQVKTVIPFWERWLRELPTIEAAANANSDKLHKLWEGLGYAHSGRQCHACADADFWHCRKSEGKNHKSKALETGRRTGASRITHHASRNHIGDEKREPELFLP
jgi:hypothetical protein